MEKKKKWSREWIVIGMELEKVPVSKASKGEGMASVADDLEDLRLEFTKAVGYQSDGVGIFKARSSGGGGPADQQKQ